MVFGPLNGLTGLAPTIEEMPRGQMVELSGGVSTFLTDTGEVDLQPVVLLHGMAATGMLNWYSVVERLRGQFRFIVYDQRWHGRGHRSMRFRFSDLADDVIRVIDHLELESPIIAGYSMGGLISQLVGHKYPDRVSGLVLCATGTGDHRNMFERTAMTGLLWSTHLFGGVPGAADVPAERLYDRATRWALHELSSVSLTTSHRVLAEVGKFNSTPWLHKINVPSAVVHTEKDIAFPERSQQTLVDRIPLAKEFRINAGHAACATHPDIFAEAVDDGIRWIVSHRDS